LPDFLEPKLVVMGSAEQLHPETFAAERKPVTPAMLYRD
jgi:hypothetical protein